MVELLSTSIQSLIRNAEHAGSTAITYHRDSSSPRYLNPERRLPYSDEVDIVNRPRMLLPSFFYLINGERTHKTDAFGYAVASENAILVFDRGSGTRKNIVDRSIEILAAGRKVIDIGTHNHEDHVGGVTSELWLPEKQYTVFPTGDETGADLYQKRAHSKNPTRILHDSEIMYFDDITLTVITTPGHSPGHACYKVEKGDTSVLILGDLAGGHSERIGSDLIERERSVRKVNATSFDYFVEGHGSFQSPLRPRKEFEGMWRHMGENMHKGFRYLLDPMYRE